MSSRFLSLIAKSSMLVLLAMVIISITPDTANAGYLDPGSGSTLVQGIIAVIAAVKGFFNKLLGRKPDGDE